MNGLISNVIMGVGKQLWQSLSDGQGATASTRLEQLQRFEQRLDHAVNPEKAAFKAYLTQQSVDSIEGVEFLSQKLQDRLLSDPSMTQFVAQNGGRSADFMIEQRGEQFVLSGTSGREWVVPANSAVEQTVSQLHHLENIRQLASLRPGLNLPSLVDLAFSVEVGALLG